MMGKPQPIVAGFPKLNKDILPMDYKQIDRAKYLRDNKQMYFFFKQKYFSYFLLQ